MKYTQIPGQARESLYESIGIIDERQLSQHHSLLHTRTGVTHTLRVHILALEDVQVHFPKTICKYRPEQLGVLKTVILLRKILTRAVLFGPARAEHVAHAQSNRRGIVLQEALLDRNIDTSERLDISLRRTL